MRDYADIKAGLSFYAATACGENETRCLLAAAEAIEELLDELTTIRKQLPHWISVEERLPEKHKTVLFYIPWNKTNMIGWIDEGGGINLEGYGKCYDFSLIKPSYWMPIPKAPKEVE